MTQVSAKSPSNIIPNPWDFGAKANFGILQQPEHSNKWLKSNLTSRPAPSKNLGIKPHKHSYTSPLWELELSCVKFILSLASQFGFSPALNLKFVHYWVQIIWVSLIDSEIFTLIRKRLVEINFAYQASAFFPEVGYLSLWTISGMLKGGGCVGDGCGGGGGGGGNIYIILDEIHKLKEE